MTLLAGLLCACQNGKCFYCGIGFSGPVSVKKGKKRDDQWTRDHVWPKAAGGHAPFNIVLACVRCNRVKGARYPMADERAKALALHERVNELARAMTGMPFWGAASHTEAASGTGGYRWPRQETGVTAMGEMLGRLAA